MRDTTLGSLSFQASRMIQILISLTLLLGASGLGCSQGATRMTVKITKRPQVLKETQHSRYHGNVKGTIIAEVALGEVSNFSFEYDNLFDSETFELFPELASGPAGEVLEVGL